MAKTPTTATGIDLGHYCIKAVSLQKKGRGSFVVTGYSSLLVDGEVSTAEELGLYIKQTIKRLGAPSKAIGFCINSNESLIKNVEQPETPLPLLRDAIKFNGSTILDQDISNMVVDCSLNEAAAKSTAGGEESGARETPRRSGNKRQYLVAGLPSSTVDLVWAAATKEKISPRSLQLAPLAIVNSFEITKPDVFLNNSFMLVDIGHVDTSLIMISRGEVVLVRKVEYSGRGLVSYIASDSAHTSEQIQQMIIEENQDILGTAETFMSGLAREISNSIGYFESLRDESMQNVYICGGIAASQSLLQSLVNYLDIPCELWKPLEGCDTKLRDKMKEAYEADFINLAAATGAALQQFTEDKKAP